MNVRDFVGGIAAIVIGAGYLAMTLNIRASALDDTVGPAGLPRMLAVLMIALGASLCFKAIVAGRIRRKVGPVSDEGATAEAQGIGIGGVLKAGGLLLIAVGYLVAVRPLGYLPSVFALIVAAALYGGATLNWKIFAIAAGGAVFYWLLFVLALGIPLPAGEFWLMLGRSVV